MLCFRLAAAAPVLKMPPLAVGNCWRFLRQVNGPNFLLNFLVPWQQIRATAVLGSSAIISGSRIDFVSHRQEAYFDLLLIEDHASVPYTGFIQRVLSGFLRIDFLSQSTGIG